MSFQRKRVAMEPSNVNLVANSERGLCDDTANFTVDCEPNLNP
jgi:hypothetical protein